MITRRQRLIGLDAALDVSIGATCVRYHRLTEITGQFPAFPDLVAITSTWGLYCSHPLWPQYHIDLTYQQVYAKGQEALPLDAESNAFLKSLVFTSMRPVAEPGPKALKSSQLQAGVLAYQQQRWLEAEVSLQAALKGAEDIEPKNPVPAMTLYYLASTEQKLGRPADAERLFRRALDNFEAQSAVDDREVTKVYANALNDLAAIYASEAKQSTVPSVIQEKCEKADPLFRHALALREKALGPDHREVGNSLENLMFLNVDCKRWTEAEVAARRAVSFYERQRGPADQEVVYLLDGLAGIYLFQGRLAEAEVPLQRVLSSVEKAAGPTAVASKLEGYAGLLRSGGHEVEAKELEARAQAIRVEAAKRP